MVDDVYNVVERYKHEKQDFLNLTTITVKNNIINIKKTNHKLAVEWLEKKEEKLKKINGFDKIAEIRYSKTLLKEILYLRNTLYWFNKHELQTINKDIFDIFYLNFEKGNIHSITDKQLSTSTKRDYYKKVFKGEGSFFGYLGLNQMAKQVIIRKYIDDDIVRFFDEKTFKFIINNASTKSHKLAYWLLWETGIEVSALVQLKKSDFNAQFDKEFNEKYYRVTVSNDISKKSREKRYIDILNNDLNLLIDDYLASIENQERIFNINPPALNKALKIIVRKNNLKTQGEKSDEIKIKDFRSSCAMFLLNKGFSIDQIRQRLGHKPSSPVINKYVTYSGLNQKPQRELIKRDNIEEIKNKYNDLHMAFKKQEEELKEIKELVKFWHNNNKEKSLIDI